MGNSLNIPEAKLQYVFQQALDPAMSLTIEGRVYGLIKEDNLREAKVLLKDLADKIWCEAAYDPRNASTQEFADTLLPLINKLDDIIKFKK